MIKLMLGFVSLVVAVLAAALNSGEPLFTESFWYLMPIEAAVVTSMTAACVRWFKIPEGGWRQALSWLWSAVIVAAVWAVGIFVMPEPKWVNYLLSAIVLGLVSNGFYDIPTIRGIIEKIFKV